MLAPDGYPLDGPLGEKGWLWLAANIEAVLASAAEDDASADLPVLADLVPPPEPWEEEMLF
jgi:hypothetical protein